MKIYLHSDNAERNPRYPVHISPGNDVQFTGASPADQADWFHNNGDAKQMEIVFSYGVAEVEDAIGKYMVTRGIAHKTRMLRRVQQFFTRAGKPIEELFDKEGNRIFYDEAGTAFAGG